MTARYIELDAATFEQFLASKGFERSVQCNEIVYSRAHKHCKDLKVKIYTSISDGVSIGRGRGEDCIRVCSVFDNGVKSFGIARQPRTYRTGSQELIQTRTYERMRAAYQACNEWLKINR